MPIRFVPDHPADTRPPLYHSETEVRSGQEAARVAARLSADYVAAHPTDEPAPEDEPEPEPGDNE